MRTCGQKQILGDIACLALVQPKSHVLSGMQGARSSGMLGLDFNGEELLALLAGPSDPGAPGSMRSQDSALLAAYVNDCLAADGALPKVASGLSYGRLLRSRGSDLGSQRPSAGLETMQSMEATLPPHSGRGA